MVDIYGIVWVVGEWECLFQCCYQKIIEEVLLLLVECVLGMWVKLFDVVWLVVSVIGYIGVGMVEFFVDDLFGWEGEFYFLEMNIWLQVEYLVIEEIIGLDLVELQFMIVDCG